MNLKLLFVISNEETKLISLTEKYELPFNTLMHGDGTASQGILDFLGLKKTEKNILLSIIPDVIEKNIFSHLKDKTKINEIGRGIAFTVPLSSTSKYVMEPFKNVKGERNMEKSNYHLLITITDEGNAEKIMNTAKKNGANGGTLIKGRSIGFNNTFKLFNLTVEPEKDIILIVCKDNERKKIMEGILNKNGMNTDYKSMCFSLPIDSTIGIDE